MPPPVSINFFQIMPSPNPGYYSRYALRQSSKTVGYVHVITDGDGTKEIWTLYVGTPGGGNAAYTYPNPAATVITSFVPKAPDVAQAEVESGTGSNPDGLGSEYLNRIQATCRAFSPSLIDNLPALRKAAKKPAAKKPAAKKPAAKAKKKAKK